MNVWSFEAKAIAPTSDSNPLLKIFCSHVEPREPSAVLPSPVAAVRRFRVRPRRKHIFLRSQQLVHDKVRSSDSPTAREVTPSSRAHPRRRAKTAELHFS